MILKDYGVRSHEERELKKERKYNKKQERRQLKKSLRHVWDWDLRQIERKKYCDICYGIADLERVRINGLKPETHIMYLCSSCALFVSDNNENN